MDLVSEEMSRSPNYPYPAPLPSSLPTAISHFPDSDSSDEDLDLDLPPLPFTEKHKRLKLRLGPLREVQNDLELRLGAAATEPEDSAASDAFSTSGSCASSHVYQTNKPRSSREFFVTSSSGWKSTLNKVRPRISSSSPDLENNKTRLRRRARHADDVADVICGCKEDIQVLWSDNMVQELLRRRNIRLEESSGL